MKYVILAALLLTACQGKKGDMGPQGPSAPQPVPVVEDEVQKLINEENEYRLGLGQTALSSGLACTLYTITGGQRIQASIPGYNTLTGLTSVGTFLLKSPFNQPNGPISDGLSVLPNPLKTIYKNMYMLRCSGYIVVTKSDYYLFDLTSDDASLLYINGSKVIDNDNNHGAVNVSGMRYLRKGVHSFKLEYAQAGGGNQALVLKVDGSLLDPKYMVH